MSLRIFVGFVCGVLLCIPLSSLGHDSRPIFIHVDEQASRQLQLSWKVPDSLATVDAPRIDLSGDCRWARSSAPVNEADARTAPNAMLQGVRWYVCSELSFPASVLIDWPRVTPSLSTIVRVQRLGAAARTIHAGPGVTSITLPQRATTWMMTRQYVFLGVEHILLGYDHLLFVACLVLLAGTFTRITLAVTGFTLAHSVTLFCAALELIRLPLAPVEAVIGLSIVFLAVELARSRRDTLTWRYPLVIAALFGLLHGFGFASVLGEIGLPEGERIVALLSFNLGVEAGQLVFVAALVAVVRALERLTSAAVALDWFARVVVYPIGTLAMYWTIERISVLV
jgi:hydrogenase/urease accessory protein HupE